MKTNIFLLLVIINIPFIALNSIKASERSDIINSGIIDSIYSKTLGENRTLRIYVPEESNLIAKKSYPVVYLLDGDAHFYVVLNIIQQLSEVNMNLVLPKMILVGIQNTDRMRDFTPTHVSFDAHIPDSSFLKTSGGSENFTTFLEKELIPYINSKYPTSPYRVLIGHSDGGLFCVNTLLNHTHLFNGYLAIDPSMDWDNNKILDQARAALSQKNLKGTSLFMSIANQGYSDTETNKDNAAAFTLARYLDLDRSNNLRYKWHYYPDDNHSSVPFISNYDGLRFLFDFYNPKIPYTQFRDPKFNSELFMVSHFNKVSSIMGYTVNPPELVINWLGYLFIMEKQYDKAYSMFKLNTQNYPGSWNAFDSMGEILFLQGDTTASFENYKKSFELNPKNENAINMIDKLKQSKKIKPLKD